MELIQRVYLRNSTTLGTTGTETESDPLDLKKSTERVSAGATLFYGITLPVRNGKTKIYSLWRDRTSDLSVSSETDGAF